jgi:16S rRNA (cytidine1402-2'-O)-methyltransferase
MGAKPPQTSELLPREATLFVVPTPLGNLEDITLRALRVLREVDLVAAEDTRRSRVLLTHFSISKPLVSYHQHKKLTGLKPVLEVLARGGSVALVSDAGMPGIADPGHELISATRESGYRVEVLPGPSAVTVAYVAAAIPAPGFLFVGFLPRTNSGLARRLDSLISVEEALVFFESPRRLRATLAALRNAYGSRPAAIVREISKVHEEVIRGDLDSLPHVVAQRELRGEITLVIGGCSRAKSEVSDADLIDAVSLLVQAGKTQRDAVAAVARSAGIPRSRVYALWTQELRRGPGI